MTAPNSEAVEAALTAFFGGPTALRGEREHMHAALTAALPFLAPQPSGEPPFDTFGSVIDGMPDTAFVVAFYDEHANYLGDMGAKSLRKLIAPQPSGSDEERAADCIVHSSFSQRNFRFEEGETKERILALVSAVRAEATLAGAAAERERILMEIAEKSPEIAAAIRARKP